MKNYNELEKRFLNMGVKEEELENYIREWVQEALERDLDFWD